MPRHSFIQMTKLHNVMGRIDYITSTVKQEIYMPYMRHSHFVLFGKILQNATEKNLLKVER